MSLTPERDRAVFKSHKSYNCFAKSEKEKEISHIAHANTIEYPIQVACNCVYKENLKYKLKKCNVFFQKLNNQ